MASSDLRVTVSKSVVRGCALIAVAASLACQSAAAKTIGLEFSGNHRPVRVRISSPQRTIQITDAMKSTVNIQAEDGAVVQAFYVDGGKFGDTPIVYSIRFASIGEGLVINLGRALRSGCDRNFIEEFRAISNDFDSRIRNILDFRYFAIFCNSPDLKMMSIRQYCMNLFALDTDAQFGLISDFVNDGSLNSKNCVSKIKVALS